MTNAHLKGTISIVLLILVSLSAHAQPGPPPANPVPLSGIEFLLGAGALVGVKRIWENRKSNKSS